MLKITLTGGPQFVEKLKAKGPTIAEVLRSKLNAALFNLQSYIVTSKLSGQMLKRRTGKLAGSIRVVPASFEGTSIVGAVEGAGSVAWYGKLYESQDAGGTGGVPHSWQIIASKARVLSFIGGDGNRVFVRRVMHPPIAMRPFMSSSLTEKAEEIKAELQAALDAEIAK